MEPPPARRDPGRLSAGAPAHLAHSTSVQVSAMGRRRGRTRDPALLLLLRPAASGGNIQGIVHGQASEVYPLLLADMHTGRCRVLRCLPGCSWYALAAVVII